MKGDCETVSRLIQENVTLHQSRILLGRLLAEVQAIHEHESRYDTALRYIREVEARRREARAAQENPFNTE